MSKKTKSPKLPKTIAGVTIPKELRKTGGALLARAGTPEGRQALAAGLTMAAAAATAAAGWYRAPRPPVDAAPPAPASPEATAAPHRPGEGGTTVDPQAIADAIGQAADAVFGRLFGPRPPR